VRNDKGEVVAAMAKSVPFIDDPATAEAMAAWGAVCMCVDNGFNRVVLEGDSVIGRYFSSSTTNSLLESIWSVAR